MWLAGLVAVLCDGESLKLNNHSGLELQLILYWSKKPSALWSPHCIWVAEFFHKVSHGVLGTWTATLFYKIEVL